MPPASASRHLLYVEDDRINVILLEEALRHVPGWTLQVAETGAQALSLLAAAGEPPALVLIDVHLPDMSGIELMERLRADARWRDLHCVAVSADDPCDLVAAARAAGFADYWLKPIDLQRLPA